MWIAIITLFISGWLVVYSTNLLIHQTKEIAFRFHVTKMFVALVLMSLGTSLPELTVSSLATLSNDPGLAVGGIVGSNITNATLIIGVAFLINSTRIGTRQTQHNAYILLLVTAIFIFLYSTPFSLNATGTILIASSIVAIIWQYIHATRVRINLEQRFLSHIPQHHLTTAQVLARTLFGLFLLVISGTLLVFSVQSLSGSLGISTTILGLTIAALATSLPEMVAIVIAQRQHEEKIAIGNVLGSNIYNLAFIGGVMTLNLPYPVRLGGQAVILTIFTLVLFGIIKYWKDKYVPKIVGIILIIGYILYLVSTFLM